MDTTPQQRVLAACVHANVPVMMWSEPGVGKSAFIETVFPEHGYHVEPVISSHRDPSDFNGLPVVDAGQVRLAPPAWANAVNAADKAILFLDEFSQAAPMTQAAALRLLNERMAGETRLGDEVRIILAANPPESAAGGFDLAPPTANRMVHLDWAGLGADDFGVGLAAGFAAVSPNPAGLVRTPSESDVLWARQAVAAYVSVNPTALHSLPQDPAAAGRGWASHRSWEMLAKVLPFLDPADAAAVLALASGCVGEGQGVQFAAWLKDADLPHPREVLDDPDSYDWDDPRADRTFALASGIVATVIASASEADHKKAWACMGKANAAGRADIAVAIGRRLIQVGAENRWLPKREVLEPLLPALAAAGLDPRAA